MGCALLVALIVAVTITIIVVKCVKKKEDPGLELSEKKT